jgi:L-arabinokinase
LSADPLRITTVCSAHGFGHATRQLAIASELHRRGAEISVLSTMPPFKAARLAPGVGARSWEADVGVVQVDALREDVPATRRRLTEVCSEERIDRLAGQIAGSDLVVADVPPTALEAARRVGVPAVAVGNFDWAWIYRQIPELADWAERFAAWQRPHPAISLEPGPGMEGFDRVQPAGIVGFTASAPAPLPRPAVLVGFGGWGFGGLAEILPELPGVTWVSEDPDVVRERADAVALPDAPYPAIVAGADAVVTKPGYGIIAEALLAGTRLVWFPRPTFPETPFLEEVLVARGDRPVQTGDGSVEARRAGVALAVAEALAAPPPSDRPSSAVGEVAETIMAMVG